MEFLPLFLQELAQNMTIHQTQEGKSLKSKGFAIYILKKFQKQILWILKINEDTDLVIFNPFVISLIPIVNKREKINN